MMIKNRMTTSATRYCSKGAAWFRSGVAAVAVLAVSGALAQPVQTIPEIKPMATEIYRVSHQDMNWHEHGYRIFVAVPERDQDAQAPVPVLYMLDGNAQFPLAVNAVAEQWSARAHPASSKSPLPLIVGLGYPEDKAYPLQARERDYTYAAPGEQFAKGGGAADFYGFLQDAVRPYIKRQYATESGKQILAGHSYGGLFALYVLLNHRDAFDQYVIGSPSLWWGHAAIVSDAKLPTSKPAAVPGVNKERAAQGAVNGTVEQNRFVTILQGEYEAHPEANPDMNPERLARMQQRRSPITASELNLWLQARGMNSHFILVEKSGHGGVIPAVIRTAAQAALQNK